MKSHIFIHKLTNLVPKLFILFLSPCLESFFIQCFDDLWHRLEHKIVDCLDVLVSFQLNDLVLQSVNDMVFLYQLLLEGKILIVELIVLFLLAQLVVVIHLLENQILLLGTA